MLSPVLAGEKAFADIVINDEAWYRDNAITFHSGVAVSALDRKARVVRSADRFEAPYDRVIPGHGVGPDPASPCPARS